MQCPFDSTTLTPIRRHDVEIEWCPSCKGVWLERGELDKIIERAAAEDDRDRRDFDRDRGRDGDRDRDRGRDHDDRHYDDDRKYRPKRKSFLSELFD